MSPDRMKNLREQIEKARAAGAVGSTVAYMMPVSLDELIGLLDRAERYDARTSELLGSANRYQQLYRDTKAALQAAVTLSEKAVGSLVSMNAVVDHQTNRTMGMLHVDGYGITMQRHPLTCGNDSNHTPLFPRWNGQKVVLVCRDCDYTQDNAAMFGG